MQKSSDYISLSFKANPRKRVSVEVRQRLAILDPGDFVFDLEDPLNQTICIAKDSNLQYHILKTNMERIPVPTSDSIFDIVDWFAGSPIKHIKVYKEDMLQPSFIISYAN